MAYNEKLAERIRNVLKDNNGYREQKMFGGIAFMLHGNMCCGVHEENLILRLSKELVRDALGKDDSSLFDITGKPMNTMLTIPQKKLKTATKLKKWLAIAVEFNGTLPPKPKK